MACSFVCFQLHVDDGMEAYVDDGSLTADMIEMPFIHIFTNSCGSSYTRAWNGALSKCRRKECHHALIPLIYGRFKERFNSFCRLVL